MPNKQAEGFMKRLPAQTNTPLPMPSFSERLQEGERLLWEGQPNIGQFIRPKVAAICLLALPLLLLFVLQAAGGKTPLPVILAIGVGAWLLGCWFSTQNMKAQAVTAAYALTSRRLFIRRLERLTVKDYRPKIDEIPLQTIRPKLRSLGAGLGTITLGAPVWKYEAALRAIPSAANVYAQITEAQALLAQALLAETTSPSSVSSEPYYTTTETKAQGEAPWKLEDILRRGETILWEGAMDAATDWRAGRWAVLIIPVVMAAIGGLILYELGIWSWAWQALVFAASAAIVVPIALSDARSAVGRPRYALTNRRVLVISSAAGKTPEVEDRELPETVKMRLARGRNGFGTIVFEKMTRFTGDNTDTYEFSFKHIADAEAVFGQIAAARQSYIAASAPKPSAPTALALQDGAQPG